MSEEPDDGPSLDWIDEDSDGAKPKRFPTVVIVLIVCAALIPTGIIGLGMLSVLVVPQVMTKLQVARQGKANADLAYLSNAVLEYAIANGGEFPDEISRVLERNGGSVENQGALFDPWDHPYIYEPPGPDSLGKLYSTGADGAPGGEGDDADIITFYKSR